MGPSSEVREGRPSAGVGPGSPGATLYAGYLGLQALLGIGLWVSLATSATVRSAFELTPERSWVTDAFVYPDLVVTVVGSGLSAWGVAAAKRWAVPVVAFTAGSVVYPTIYLFAWVAKQGTGSVALWVMVVVSTLTSWIAWQTYRAWR